VEGEQPEPATTGDQLADAGIAKLQVQLDRRGRGGAGDVGYRSADRAARTDHQDPVVAAGPLRCGGEAGLDAVAELRPGFRHTVQAGGGPVVHRVAEGLPVLLVVGALVLDRRTPP